MKAMMKRIWGRITKTETRPENVEDLEITVTMTSKEWETVRAATIVCKYAEAVKENFGEDFDWTTFEKALQEIRWSCKEAYAYYYDGENGCPEDY